MKRLTGNFHNVGHITTHFIARNNLLCNIAAWQWRLKWFHLGFTHINWQRNTAHTGVSNSTCRLQNMIVTRNFHMLLGCVPKKYTTDLGSINSIMYDRTLGSQTFKLWQQRWVSVLLVLVYSLQSLVWWQRQEILWFIFSEILHLLFKPKPLCGWILG